MKEATIYLKSGLRRVVLIISVLLLPGLLMASGDTENTAVKTINPPAEFQALHAADPESVHRGKLNSMDKQGAMIDGTYKRFSPSVSFLSYDGKPLKKSRFVPGMPVGFRLNSRDEIIGLWDRRPELRLIP